MAQNRLIPLISLNTKKLLQSLNFAQNGIMFWERSLILKTQNIPKYQNDLRYFCYNLLATPKKVVEFNLGWSESKHDMTASTSDHLRLTKICVLLKYKFEGEKIPENHTMTAYKFEGEKKRKNTRKSHGDSLQHRPPPPRTICHGHCTWAAAACPVSFLYFFAICVLNFCNFKIWKNT